MLMVSTREGWEDAEGDGGHLKRVRSWRTCVQATKMRRREGTKARRHEGTKARRRSPARADRHRRPARKRRPHGPAAQARRRCRSSVPSSKRHRRGVASSGLRAFVPSCLRVFVSSCLRVSCATGGRRVVLSSHFPIRVYPARAAADPPPASAARPGLADRVRARRPCPPPWEDHSDH